jgi:hypothetical protein
VTASVSDMPFKIEKVDFVGVKLVARLRGGGSGL